VNDLEEPSIPPHWRRPLTAAWISLAVHAAVLALVQVAPPATVSLAEPVIEARLAPAMLRAATPAAESAPEAIEEAPQDAPPEPEPPKPVRLPPADPVPEAVPVQPPAAEPAPVRIPVPAPKPPEPAPVTAQSTAPAPSEREVADERAEQAPPTQAPAAAITSAVDLTYYSVRELDVQPRALREIVPTYPGEADRQRLSGKVRLQLKLEADGRISDVEVVSATPPGVFDASAAEAFREARFAPAQKGGRPVRARVVIEVLYDWEGRMRRQ
jgi:protein TonB